MLKIKAAVIGYGNVGRYAAQAVISSPDIELCGIVRRTLAQIPELPGVPVVESILDLGKIDLALICSPTRNVLEHAISCLESGISTVDSFDIHPKISEMRDALDVSAKKGAARAIVAAGWDPGSDSVIRALFEACAPKGITYTNFGPGMSMGHTVAVKAIPGVDKAISITIPTGCGIHQRVVYLQLKPGASLENVAADIKRDPYFKQDETSVIQVDNIDDYMDSGHGVSIERKGASGATDNQTFRFSMSVNNPALTSQIMVSCARAAMRQPPGAYTMIELPIIDLLPGDRREIIGRIV